MITIPEMYLYVAKAENKLKLWTQWLVYMKDEKDAKTLDEQMILLRNK